MNLRIAWLVLGMSGAANLLASDPDSAMRAAPVEYGQPADLPKPSSLSVNAFEERLFDFVNRRQYAELGWKVDKSVRDTGPFVDGKYYGTHPAVRIYYSPEVVRWLVGGRQTTIPDGAMIVKEQYHPPAARYEGMDEDQLWDALESWTIMVKDSAGSHDGWFWSNPAKNQQVVDYYSYPFEEPYSGFGLYCVRCHASTTSPGPTQEYTFASLRNIEGFPGEPLLFRVDDSWRDEDEDLANEHKLADLASRPPEEVEVPFTRPLPTGAAHPRCTESDFPQACIPHLNQEFVEHFPGVAERLRSEILHLPPVTFDSVPRAAQPSEASPRTQSFVTSNQCMSCHAGITEPFGPNMFIPTGDSAGYGEPGLHVSPYGEWRWTPMGLAGRDPVFFAQLESELALLRDRYDPKKANLISEHLQSTCLSCHGVMGKRQHDIDHPNGPMFSIADVYEHQIDPNDDQFPHSRYGALARDGISCAVCHRMQAKPQPADDNREYLEFFLENSITGNFELGKPSEIYGPYKDDQIAPYVMEHALGFKPKHSDYVRQSQMCGSCHTVNLPIVDWDNSDIGAHNDLMLAERNPVFRDFHHHVEQATYLEWLNSQFENEINPENHQGKSCQDCHMSRGVHDNESGIDVQRIESRIAAVQDQTYPDAEYLAAHEEIRVRHRKEYARHNFRGLNLFMLEMFNQFDDVLGVRKHDYMTGSKTDIAHASRDFVRQASSETANIDVQARWGEGDTLIADVDIRSHVGHRFPSGVGFRRAFVELLVIDESRPPHDRIVWSSGRTNSVGIITDHQGRPLPTEFFERDAEGREVYQPHHEIITSSDQVQIYETLLHSRSGEFTTSFIHGCTTIKDNRFLPQGWTLDGPGGGLKGHFLTSTYPGPLATRDKRYQDGSGSDQISYHMQLPNPIDRRSIRVQATIFYQAIPPYFLKNIFDLSPGGPATQRLYYICSNLKLEGTPIEGWKLKVVSDSTRPLP